MRHLYNLFFGLTQTEMEQIDTDVVLAVFKVRNNPRQLKLAKKLIRLLEDKES